jgi:hypothetical protein
MHPRALGAILAAGALAVAAGTPAAAPRRYYDPGTAPRPRAPGDPRATPAGPVSNSRPHRRQRSRLSFPEQHALAKACGFPVPSLDEIPSVDSKEIPAFQERWIDKWERLYASR